MSKPVVKQLSGVKNRDIHKVLKQIFIENNIENREDLIRYCALNANGRSKYNVIYSCVYEKLPGVLTMHPDGEAAAKPRIRRAYQAMLPGYSIYNQKKYPVSSDSQEKRSFIKMVTFTTDN